MLYIQLRRQICSHSGKKTSISSLCPPAFLPVCLSGHWVDNEEMKQWDVINYKFREHVCSYIQYELTGCF